MKTSTKHFGKADSIRTPALRAAFLGMTLVLTAPLAQAIVSYNAASRTSGVGVSELDGVANITITNSQGYETCSGTLVDGGAYVLTAAHCFTEGGATPSPASAVSMAFESGTVNASANAVYVDPAWKGVAGDFGDIALIKLAAPITNIASTNLDYNSALGSEVLIAGVGLLGTGATGENVNSNLNASLYYGYNQYDSSSGSDFYLFDFDNGTAAQNVFGSLGLGTSEALTAEGDSGGPSLVLVNGAWLLAGVHSYGAEGSQPGAVAFGFGSYTGDTSIAGNATWLESYLASPVPEPSHWALMLSGLCIIAASGRRRMRRRDL